jgi:predicted ATP-grasp superfamily ATP-dependent carboligase
LVLTLALGPIGVVLFLMEPLTSDTSTLSLDLEVPARVLITDAQERASLAACRGLSQAGYSVAGVATTRPAAGLWSRHCSERLHLPDPVRDSQGFVQALEQVVRRNHYAAVIPGGDASLLAISQHRDRLEPHVRLGMPLHEAVERCVDKLSLVEEAAKAGVPCPNTVACSSYEQAASAAGELGFPVVLKPRRTVFPFNGSMRQLPSAVVWDEASLAAKVPRFGNPCLVQFNEQGPIYSCSGVMIDDDLLAFATCRYLRTYPPDGGNVAFSQTVTPPSGLRPAIRALLAGLGWQGIFEVELVRRSDGSFCTIDLNPRVFGSLAVVIAAGAALPAIWCDWILERNPKQATARAGVRYRWEDADARHLVWQLRRGKLRAAAAVMRPRRRVVHAYFRLRDPGPLFARLLYMTRSYMTQSWLSRPRRKEPAAPTPEKPAPGGDSQSAEVPERNQPFQ